MLIFKKAEPIIKSMKRMKRIPLVPMPMDMVRRISKHYLGWGEAVSKFFPSLAFDLEQSGIDFEPREWAAVAIYAFLSYFFVLAAVIIFFGIQAGLVLRTTLLVSGMMGLVIGGGTFIYLIFYPKLSVGRRVKNIESHLPHALHHLLIQVRSGVPLFNSMVSLAKSGYGILSEEFSHAVNKINTGTSEIAALETMAKENPSLYFRRVMWQMVNALKSGADIGSTIKEIVESLAAEQRVAIKKYGSELNPLALFYMILVVIFPTLGIIFILILFSFVGALLSIEFVLGGILLFIIIFQFMFIGLIKSKRPVGI